MNDAHGHALGDDLLIAVARRLQSVRGPRETVSRFGGDEFVVFAGGVASIDAAVAMARRFAAVFGAPFTVGEGQFPVTVSVGVDFSPAGATVGGPTLLRNADTAMYRAKSLGRNRVVPFTEGLRRELLERIDLEAELRSAVTRREFLCHYQPLIDLASRQPVRRRGAGPLAPSGARRASARELPGGGRARGVRHRDGAAGAGDGRRAGRSLAPRGAAGHDGPERGLPTGHAARSRARSRGSRTSTGCRPTGCAWS